MVSMDENHLADGWLWSFGSKWWKLWFAVAYATIGVIIFFAVATAVKILS